jgi:hypothetical protein
MLFSMKKQKQADYQHALLALRLQRLQFAVRFAQMDLPTLRDGDWLNLHEDMETFLGLSSAKCHVLSPHGGVIVLPCDEFDPADDDSRDYAGLQADVCTIFAACVGEALRGRPPVTITPQLEVHSVVPTPEASDPGERGGHVIIARGTTREMFLYLLLDDLKEEPRDRILRCPQCHTLFVRVYTQVYCSRRCTNRAGVRTWRARHAVASRGN